MEFDHDGLRVGVSRVVNQVPELVEVVVNCPPTLEVRRRLQGVDCGGLCIEGSEVLTEFFLEVGPIEESESSFLGGRFEFELSGCPAAGSSGVHVRHGPHDFGDFVFEGFGA